MAADGGDAGVVYRGDFEDACFEDNKLHKARAPRAPRWRALSTSDNAPVELLLDARGPQPSGTFSASRLRALSSAASRACAHSAFVVVLLASFLASLVRPCATVISSARQRPHVVLASSQSPLVLALLDATLHCLLLATRGHVHVPARYPSLTRLANASLHAHPDHLVKGFRFRTSAADVAALSCVRAMLAIVAWGLCSSRANLFRPYLLSSYASAAMALGLVAVKAPLYKYTDSRGPVWLAPLLFAMSLAAALGHVALASQAASASRRRRSHLEGCSSAEEYWASPVAGVPASGSARPASAHRRRQSREDVEAALRDAGETDTPAALLADAASLFADVCGDDGAADTDGVGVAPHAAGASCCQSVHYRHTPAPAGCESEGAAEAHDTAALLLHGFGGGEHSWRAVAPLLARRCACRVIAFDRCGFGLSSRPAAFAPANNPYTLRSAARVAVALCRQLGVRRLLLVGHADGCTLALLIASLLREQPDAQQPGAMRCVALALVAPNAPGEAVPTSTRLLLKSSVGLPLLRPLLRSEVGEASLRRAFFAPARLTPAVLARYAEPLRVCGWDRALWEVARCAGEVTPAELLALAERARVPALVVSGAADRVAPHEVAASLSRALGTGVPCVLLPECGHLPHEEAPASLVAILAPWATAALAAEAATLPEAAPASPTGVALCCQV
jgi:pimeloyl-ACP methyl ester carboxylesterase